jgi:hypothetical protein
MNADSPFERLLADVAAEAAGPARPVDVAAVVRATADAPRWKTQPLFDATRFAVAAVVVAIFGGLLLVSQTVEREAVTVPGAETEGLPPVTGPAGSGLITFVHDGDIVVGDPATGESAVIVDGENGFRPVFSPDGTRISFLRLLGHSPEAPCDIVVVRADGSDERVITPTDNGVGCISAFRWAPDSRAVVVLEYTPDWPWLLLDASGVPDPVVLPTINDVAWTDASFMRPPAGDLLLTWGAGRALGIVRPDGSGVLDLGELSGLEAMGYDGFVDPAWSPDGSRVAVLAKAGDERHVYVMDADGYHLRRLGQDVSGVRPAVPWDDNLWLPSWSWSPDGSTIAVKVVGPVEPGSREFCPAREIQCPEWIVLMDVETGAQRDLDATYSDTPDGIFHWSWSPDGQAILLQRDFEGRPEVVDIASDTSTELPWESDSVPSWQRVAVD